MGAGRNKALLDLGGRPVILHSIETFRGCCRRLVVVSAESDWPEMRALVPDALLVAGGVTRHGSEWNAIQALADASEADVIAFHDAARPLV